MKSVEAYEGFALTLHPSTGLVRGKDEGAGNGYSGGNQKSKQLLSLAAATFAFVGAAQATAQASATTPSAKAAVVKYLAMVGQQNSQAYSPINII